MSITEPPIPVAQRDYLLTGETCKLDQGPVRNRTIMPRLGIDAEHLGCEPLTFACRSIDLRCRDALLSLAFSSMVVGLVLLVTWKEIIFFIKVALVSDALIR